MSCQVSGLGRRSSEGEGPVGARRVAFQVCTRRDRENVLTTCVENAPVSHPADVVRLAEAQDGHAVVPTNAFEEVALYVGNCNFRGSSGGRNLALIMLTLIMSLWKPSVVNRGNPPKKGKKRLNEENLDQTQTDIRPPPICMDYVLRSHGSGTGGRHDHHS